LETFGIASKRLFKWIVYRQINSKEKQKRKPKSEKINCKFEKNKSDGIWIEVNGDVSLVNKLYDMVVKINRNKSNFFTKIKNRIVKTFEQFTQKT
jgi:hypothetical protein